MTESTYQHRGSMWNIVNKLALVGVSSMLAATASLSAADDFYSYRNDSYCDFNPAPGINPGFDFCGNDYQDECCGADWSFDAEVLIWKSHVDGLPVGRTTTNVPGATIPVVIPGGPTVDILNSQTVSRFTRYLKHDWKPGVRLTLGYHDPCSCWDFDLIWTNLYSSADASIANASSVIGTPGTFLESAWLSGATPPFDVTDIEGGVGLETERRALGDWSLHLNTFEFSFGHTFSACCEAFLVRPHVDLKLACIRQRFTSRLEADYEGVLTTGGVRLPFTLTDRVQLHRRYFGVGPQVGLDVTYNFSEGFGVFAKAAAALLYSQPELHFRGTSLSSTTTTAPLNFSNNTSHFRRTDPRNVNLNTTLAAGLAYNRQICDDSYRFSIKVGWEHQLYTDQNQFQRAVLVTTGIPAAGVLSDLAIPTERGDLSLYGVTVSVGLDF